MANKMPREKPKPKGAMSSYACFVQVIREEHRKKHPEKQIVFNEFSKKCAETWKLMTVEEKRRFEEMSDLDKSRHTKEMDEYVATKSGRKAKKRRTKDPNEPKRAWSAFFFYSNEFRPVIMQEHPEWKVGDVAKELGKRWELCPDKEKYEEMAKNDKERYVKDMENFKAGIYVPPKMGKSLHGIADDPPKVSAAITTPNPVKQPMQPPLQSLSNHQFINPVSSSVAQVTLTSPVTSSSPVVTNQIIATPPNDVTTSSPLLSVPITTNNVPDTISATSTNTNANINPVTSLT